MGMESENFLNFAARNGAFWCNFRTLLLRGQMQKMTETKLLQITVANSMPSYSRKDHMNWNTNSNLLSFQWFQTVRLRPVSITTKITRSLLRSQLFLTLALLGAFPVLDHDAKQYWLAKNNVTVLIVLLGYSNIQQIGPADTVATTATQTAYLDLQWPPNLVARPTPPRILMTNNTAYVSY